MRRLYSHRLWFMFVSSMALVDVVVDRIDTCGFQAPVLSQRFPQHEFDLRIDAAQVVIGPSLHGIEHGRTDAQRVGFLIRGYRSVAGFGRNAS